MPAVSDTFFALEGIFRPTSDHNQIRTRLDPGRYRLVHRPSETVQA